jgi:hypothetical protein
VAKTARHDGYRLYAKGGNTFFTFHLTCDLQNVLLFRHFFIRKCVQYLKNLLQSFVHSLYYP